MTDRSTRPRPRFSATHAALAACLIGGQCGGAQALSITFDGAIPSAAQPALTRAAAQWTSRLTDPINVTIRIGFDNFASNVIGQASSVQLSTDKNEYSLVRQALIDDADAGDTLVNALPSQAQLNAQVHLPTGITFNGGIIATKANFKAMGFTDLDTLFGVTDGTITFNNFFSFDYNGQNGVNGTDFETVAVHEIGHILGFQSAVDIVDFALANHLTGDTEIYPLDLFRFAKATAPKTAAEFTTAMRELTPGGTAAVFSDLVNAYGLATGMTHGDGNQASHFKADEASGIHVGVMDPTLAPNHAFGVTAGDLRVLDLIGWDVAPVPLPPAFALFAPVLGLLVRIRRAS